jgi:hypothetical protein
MGGLLMPTTNWYTWLSQSDFDAWHNPVVEALHLPRVGHNAATGEPRPEAQQTTAYTDAVEVAADDWRAPVEQHVADVYTTGLGALSEPPPAPEFDL